MMNLLKAERIQRINKTQLNEKRDLVKFITKKFKERTNQKEEHQMFPR